MAAHKTVRHAEHRPPNLQIASPSPTPVQTPVMDDPHCDPWIADLLSVTKRAHYVRYCNQITAYCYETDIYNIALLPSLHPGTVGTPWEPTLRQPHDSIWPATGKPDEVTVGVGLSAFSLRLLASELALGALDTVHLIASLNIGLAKLKPEWGPPAVPIFQWGPMSGWFISTVAFHRALAALTLPDSSEAEMREWSRLLLAARRDAVHDSFKAAADILSNLLYKMDQPNANGEVPPIPSMFKTEVRTRVHDVALLLREMRGIGRHVWTAPKTAMKNRGRESGVPLRMFLTPAEAHRTMLARKRRAGVFTKHRNRENTDGVDTSRDRENSEPLDGAGEGPGGGRPRKAVAGMAKASRQPHRRRTGNPSDSP